MKELSKPCLECGQTIMKPQTESLKNWHSRHRFCSRPCAAIHHHRVKPFGCKFSKERHFIPKTAFKKGDRPSKSTEFKKGFVPWNKGTKGLMPEPWNKGREWIEMQGNNHPMWKDGRVSLRKRIRVSTKYRWWRLEIFKRDNYSCVKCGRRRKAGDRVILEADHFPITFSYILDKYKIKNWGDAHGVKILWDIDNGRTLCRECHRGISS